MSLSTYFGNVVLNLLRGQEYNPPAGIFASLHDGDPGLAGANEIAGAARQAVVLAVPAGKATSNTGVLSYTGMPIADVMAVGIWDDDTDGNFIAAGPLAGGLFSALASSDAFNATGHGLVDGAKVAFCIAPGVTLPTGITAWTSYYVVNATENTFQVSLTEGGAAVNLTTDGGGRYITVKRTNLGDTFQIAVGDLDLSID